MVHEVVAGQGVDELTVAAQVRAGDGHELALAGACRHSGGPGHEVLGVGGEECRRDEDHRVLAGARGVDDCGGSGGVTDHELVEKVLWERRRHGATVEQGADTALTPP